MNEKKEMCPVCGKMFEYVRYHLSISKSYSHRRYWLQLKIHEHEAEIRELKKELASLPKKGCKHKTVKRLENQPFWECYDCGKKFVLAETKEKR